MINGNRMGRRPVLVSEDDNEHASLIQERVKRERPCRTLFIRNIAVSLIAWPSSGHLPCLAAPSQASE